MILKLSIVFLSLWVSFNVEAQQKTSATVEHFAKQVSSQDVQLIDVRTSEEYESGYIDHALLANWKDSTAFRESIGPLDKEKTIYVYCRSGNRSNQAADWLLLNGYKDVVNLDGGILAWAKSGRELKKPPTKLTIRVKAKDAKFIGTGLGGASVVVRDDLTGALLAKGITSGSSGDTKLLLQTPLQRHQPQTDDATAKYVATIAISEPTLVDVEVVAPLGRKGAAVKGSTQLWLVPGKHVLGDGLVIELPGLILDILSPTTHQVIPYGSIQNNGLTFRANLTMLCGCPISKDGVWDSNDYEVKGILKKDGVEIATYDLRKLDEANAYEGNLKITDKGVYELLVYAFSAKNNNSGVDKINFVVD